MTDKQFKGLIAVIFMGFFTVFGALFFGLNKQETNQIIDYEFMNFFMIFVYILIVGRVLFKN